MIKRDQLFTCPLKLTSFANSKVAVTDPSTGCITLIDGESGEVIATRQTSMKGVKDITHDISFNLYVYYSISNTPRPTVTPDNRS